MGEALLDFERIEPSHPEQKVASTSTMNDHVNVKSL